MTTDAEPLTIFFIRHADKPVTGIKGVDATGHPDQASLTPRGWQRAGAWVQCFKPALGDPVLPCPTAIFGSDHREGAGKRSLETVTALAALLSLDVDRRFTKGQEAELARTIQAMSGVVLVSWQHENIHHIVQGLDPPPDGVPVEWPDDCFNAIYHLERAPDHWKFNLLMPQLLDGDSDIPF